MDNLVYVQTVTLDVETQQTMFHAMAEYGGTHWWEPGVHPYVLAYYQFHESVLLVDFGVFRRAVEQLLGRSLHPTDLVTDIDRLRQEVNDAWQLKQQELF